VKIIIYEPTLTSQTFADLKVVNDFDEFECQSDVIVANRMEKVLCSCWERVYTRDLFTKD